MSKKIFLAALILFPILSLAQEAFYHNIDSITTIERAEKFVSSQKNKENKIIIFNEEKHKTRLSKELFTIPTGGVKVIEGEYNNSIYKVIEKSQTPYYRVQYILLDGTQIPITKIDNLREQLIAMIKNGIPFKDLALQYSMDTNRKRGGDSGWLTSGEMLPEFEIQVMNSKHEVDEIFNVNVESNKWYYVVKQTYPNKEIAEIKVLKVVKPKS